MNIKKLEKWVWILVYAGLVIGGLGLAVQRSDASLGWGLVSLGGAAILAGALLIWVRSRIKTDQT
jgi:hypothetical protein